MDRETGEINKTDGRSRVALALKLFHTSLLAFAYTSQSLIIFLQFVITRT